jgi:hypothetical protein
MRRFSIGEILVDGVPPESGTITCHPKPLHSNTTQSCLSFHYLSFRISPLNLEFAILATPVHQVLSRLLSQFTTVDAPKVHSLSN